MLDGVSHTLMVSPQTTVGSLKQLIWNSLKVPKEKQKLTYTNGQKIDLSDDSKTLMSYGVGPGCTIFVLITEPPTIQVFLKNEKGVTSTYEIVPGETVVSFKAKVRNREGISEDQQRLIHEGKQMDDGKKLMDYNVRAGSIIFLTLRLRGGFTC